MQLYPKLMVCAQNALPGGEFEMNKMVAVVPARLCNDEGLKNKDILPFNGENLLVHKLRQLKRIENLDVLVTSESDIILEMASKENVICLKRPIELAKSNAMFGDLVEFICCKTEEYEHIMWSCVTSPLISLETYRKAIQLYFSSLDEEFDSLVTVQRLQRYLMDEVGPINYRPGKNVTIKTQVKPIYIFTNGISIAPRESMMKWKHTSGVMPYMMELGKRESIDICDEYDYKCAKFFLNEIDNCGILK